MNWLMRNGTLAALVTALAALGGAVAAGAPLPTVDPTRGTKQPPGGLAP